jgi:hypothetical protein
VGSWGRFGGKNGQVTVTVTVPFKTVLCTHLCSQYPQPIFIFKCYRNLFAANLLFLKDFLGYGEGYGGGYGNGNCTWVNPMLHCDNHTAQCGYTALCNAIGTYP